MPTGQCGPAGGTFDIGPHNDHVTYHGFKSRASLNWKVTPTTLAYFTFSQGFRPGGFSRSQRAVAKDASGNPQYETPNSYAPDSLDNYEIGLKTALFDRRLQLNLTAYNMNWKNVQFLFYNPTQLGNTTFGVNGPNYRVRGGEVQLTARPTQGLTVTGTATYNDNKQVNSPCLVSTSPPRRPSASASPRLRACRSRTRSASPGRSPPSRRTSRVGARPLRLAGRAIQDLRPGRRPVHQRPVQRAGDVPVGDGVVLPTTTFLRYRMPGYGTIDASAGVARDGWNAQLFVTNLNNSHASTFTSSVEFIKEEIPIRPRVFGLRLGYEF